MNDLKEFVEGLPKLDETHVLSPEEQEIVEGGSGEQCTSTCASGCSQSGKKCLINKNTPLPDEKNDDTVGKENP